MCGHAGSIGEAIDALLRVVAGARGQAPASLGGYRRAKTATVRAGTVNCPVRALCVAVLTTGSLPVGLHRVQVVALTGGGSDGLGRRFVRGVEHHHETLECSIDIRSDGVVDAHHDDARGLTGPAAGEGHLLLHESFGAEVEQR